MLNSLSIKNFALIEDIELSLEDKLTIITGETGAGKSILLGALSLLLGKRANLKSIKNPQKKCIIEGVFSIGAYNLESLFKKLDLDYEGNSIIRREILPSGKSRAFVNDTPVKLKQMSALGKHLVDIHSQHETLFIGDIAYQYSVLDTLADNKELLKQYGKALNAYKQLKKELDALKAQQKEAKQSYDYHIFLLNELREAQLKPGLQKELEERYQQLSNVEELKENIAALIQNFQQEEFGLTDNLQKAKNLLIRLESFGENYKELNNRLDSVLLEVEDISAEIESLSEDIDDDPETLETVNEQLQNIYNLQNKHSFSSVEKLLDLQDELEEKVAVSEHAGEDQEKLEKTIEQARLKTKKLADRLMKKRKEVVPDFIISVVQLLGKLGMPDAQLNITIAQSNQFNAHGCDDMQWLFSANKGGRLQEVKKSASGGELSRIALVIKSILAQYSSLPTLIFDEIDTGVSGEVAQKIGSIMSAMSKNLQVLSITHLPQIAAKGAHHFKVFKETKNKNTHTTILKLNEDQRINEIAEMLSGKEKSESAITHAKVLLK